MLLRLDDKLMIADRMPGGPPGPAYGRSGWGMPSYGKGALYAGNIVPTPVGARYFCGDDYPMYEAQEHPCAMGNQYDSTKDAYQEKVTAHYTEEHPDLHYPIDQPGLDAMAKAKRHAESILRTQAELKELAKWKEDGVGGGSMDWSGSFRPVTRPRELPDFTEFDYPDANVADAATEEIELDQLISIQARQGRRFLGVELQGLLAEATTEFLTQATGADLEVIANVDLNTRTGVHNLDDPENLYRAGFALEVSSPVATEVSALQALERNEAPPGGVVYVAPRLFWRFTNDMDRQVDIGDLFTRIATIAQPLSTFLLFELLEQYSGLFGLT